MTTRIGIERLIAAEMKPLVGHRVALLGNPAAVDGSYVHLLDRCLDAGVRLVKLFGPEHGLLGDAQDMDHVVSHRDRRTGLEVVSLYGNSRSSLFLRPEQLDGVDVLVCDLQDVGSRYYTFCYTIAFAMRACRAAGVRCIVLDRPNPIGGALVEGNLVRPEFFSFVGEYPLPNRHGLTMGELAQLFAHLDESARCDLEVLWMEGWRRSFSHDESGAPWVMPSPNMPSPSTALLYPGACLYEGTNLSEGRGTTRPFELVGAPYIDDPHRFCDDILAQGIEGVALRPCWFRPTVRKHAGQLCGGLQMHVTDANLFRPLRAAVAVIAAARRFPGFDWYRGEYEFETGRLAIDLLFGDDRPRQALEAGALAADVLAPFSDDEAAISQQRAVALYDGYK